MMPFLLPNITAQFFSASEIRCFFIQVIEFLSTIFKIFSLLCLVQLKWITIPYQLNEKNHLIFKLNDFFCFLKKLTLSRIKIRCVKHPNLVNDCYVKI